MLAGLQGLPPDGFSERSEITEAERLGSAAQVDAGRLLHGIQCVPGQPQGREGVPERFSALTEGRLDHLQELPLVGNGDRRLCPDLQGDHGR
jgi:hypothetical protein